MVSFSNVYHDVAQNESYHNVYLMNVWMINGGIYMYIYIYKTEMKILRLY